MDEEEEKLDLEPEFQYIPESCAMDRSHSDPDGWKSSFQMLREGLSNGSVLAQFDVSQLIHILHLSASQINYCTLTLYTNLSVGRRDAFGYKNILTVLYF